MSGGAREGASHICSVPGYVCDIFQNAHTRGTKLNFRCSSMCVQPLSSDSSGQHTFLDFSRARENRNLRAW